MTSSFVPTGGLAITADDLLVVLADLWDATFGSPITGTGERLDSATGWWAAVDLLHDDGVVAEVVVAVEESALAAVARITFGVDQPDPDQMTDVATEAANIMGGNVKGILSMRTRLSCPRAGQGAPPLGPRPRISVYAIDDRGRRMEAHVVDTGADVDTSSSRNED